MFAQAAATWSTGFYATAMLMLALIASGFAISSALRPRGEEDAGTGRGPAGHRAAARPLAAAATSR